MSWRFAYRPKWIVRHVLVVLLVTAMVAALFWQLSRLHDKRAYKRLVEHRMEQPVVPVGSILHPGARTDPAVVGVLYRPVTATGRYVPSRTFTVENRTDEQDQPGAWVLTPLDLGDGEVVVVNRGFVGYTVDGTIVPPRAPTGRVTVTGLLFPSQHRGAFGATDPATGVLHVLARVDLDRVARQVDGDLLRAYVQLDTSRPAEPPVPAGTPEIEALGPPELSEGPHLSYAVQWAIFSTIATVGYGLLLRKVALQEGKELALAAAGPPPDDVDGGVTEVADAGR